jgi:hypothetical protein
MNDNPIAEKVSAIVTVCFLGVVDLDPSNGRYFRW